jgi:hypothetical protein
MATARDLRDEGMDKPLDRLDPYDVLFFLTSCGISFPLWDRDVEAAEVGIGRLEQIAVETARPGFASFAPILRAACARLQDDGGSYSSGPVGWSPATAQLGDAMTCIHCSFHRAADLERIRIEPSWAAAEHLRSAGEHALVQGGPNAQGSAEACFSEAASVAAQQGALFWELRAAVSLARLYRRQGKEDAARQATADVVSRFDTQETCADLADAKAFLAA